MPRTFYYFVYESENIFAYHKLIAVISLNDSEDIETYLQKNISILKNSYMDGFWIRLGKKYEIEMEYNPDMTLDDEFYERVIGKFKEKPVKLMEIINKCEYEDFVMEGMIVECDDGLLNVLMEQEHLKFDFK